MEEALTGAITVGWKGSNIMETTMKMVFLGIYWVKRG